MVFHRPPLGIRNDFYQYETSRQVLIRWHCPYKSLSLLTPFSLQLCLSDIDILSRTTIQLHSPHTASENAQHGADAVLGV